MKTKPKIKIFRSFNQKTDAWVAVKRGKSSGSKIKPIYSAQSKGPWKTYAYELIAQQQDSEPAIYKEVFLSEAVQWGNDMEPFAQKAFEKATGKIIEEVAWIESLDPLLKGKAGCSPDGIIDIEEWIEAKCLQMKKHIQYVNENVLPYEFKPQVFNYFVINPDLKVVYFILYNPRIKLKSKRLHIIPVLRENYEVQITKLYNNLVEFHTLKEELHVKFLGK